MITDIYEGAIFRPPSEAFSLILQPTIGCSWNRCTFCVAFKDKEYRVRSLRDIEGDVDRIFPYYRDVQRIFLADGNALAMPTDDLVSMLKFLYSKFKLLERVSIYGGPLDIKRRSVYELALLRKTGLDLVYFGLESGSDEVLKRVKKGATAADMVATARKVKDAGLKLSVIFILGLGGTEMSDVHAEETARIVSAQDPDYAAALTLMAEPGSEILESVRSGALTLLDPLEVLEELHITVSGINVTNTVFRANHASNYAPIGGTLPGDREKILSEIGRIIKKGRYKPEFLRAL